MAQGPPSEAPESIILGAFKGLKNTVSSERLVGEELERALNIDIDDVGQVRRRRGYTLKVTGSFHSIQEINGDLYGVMDGTLGIIRPDYTFEPLAVSVGDTPVCYTNVGDTIYFSGSQAGTITNGVLGQWGGTDGQGVWISPVQTPTDTLGAISGTSLQDPPLASELAAYNGRIYLAQDKTLWATQLFNYHYVDKTKNFMQFEQDITLLEAMTDGMYVGTKDGLYFLQGRALGEFKLTQVLDSPVLAGSAVWAPAELIHPQAVNAPMPTGPALLFMTEAGICAAFDGGTSYNLTQTEVIFPRAVTAAGLFRQDSGSNAYVVATDSEGGPSANARIGDYVDAEIVRFINRPPTIIPDPVLDA